MSYEISRIDSITDAYSIMSITSVSESELFKNIIVPDNSFSNGEQIEKIVSIYHKVVSLTGSLVPDFADIINEVTDRNNDYIYDIALLQCLDKASTLTLEEIKRGNFSTIQDDIEKEQSSLEEYLYYNYEYCNLEFYVSIVLDNEKLPYYSDVNEDSYYTLLPCEFTDGGKSLEYRSMDCQNILFKEFSEQNIYFYYGDGIVIRCKESE